MRTVWNRLWVGGAMLGVALGALPQAEEAAGRPAGRRRPPPVEHTGGFLQRPAEGPVLLYLNAQQRVSAERLAEGAEEIARATQFAYRVVPSDASKPPLDVVREALAADPEGAAFAVLLVESPTLPPSLVAQEARWAVFNVAALTGAAPADEDTLDERFRRQLWRTTTWAMGGGTSGMPSATAPAFRAEDLDTIAAVTAPDQLARMVAVGQLRGMQRRGMATYRQAVEEGWAPEPANEIQQRIWDEIRGRIEGAVAP